MGGLDLSREYGGVVTHAVARSLRDRDGRRRPSLYECSASPSPTNANLRKGFNLSSDLHVIEGRYLQDLLAQPQALSDTFAALDRSPELVDFAGRLRRGEFQQIVLTGMGSSFHAIHPLNLQLIDHGIGSTMVETSELVHYHTRVLNPKTLVIAVSQSGESAEMVRLAKVNNGAPVIAVTNTPESTLARHAAVGLVTRAGREFSVSCKTYVATLMMLQWLGDALCGQDAEPTRSKMKGAASAVAAYLADWKKRVADVAERLSGIRDLFLVGRGTSLAAVGAGALVIKESDHFHAEGMSSAAFRHGPFVGCPKPVRRHRLPPPHRPTGG